MLNFAEDGGQMKCPSCGYASDSADFSVSGGASGTSDAASSSLQTRPGNTGQVRDGVPLTVRGASSGNVGLANSYGRSIGLARRFPVQQQTDMLVSRGEDGLSVIRHRMGGTEVGKLRRNEDGTWTPVVDGKDLSPYNHQRSAIVAMLGTYNRSVAQTPMLQPPAQQTELMQQFGVPAIRLAADDPDDNDAASADTSSSSGGLTPRGQGIYKKLIAKGMSPKVAMAMAKRAQNTSPGSFGNAKAS